MYGYKTSPTSTYALTSTCTTACLISTNELRKDGITQAVIIGSAPISSGDVRWDMHCASTRRARSLTYEVGEGAPEASVAAGSLVAVESEVGSKVEP